MDCEVCFRLGAHTCHDSAFYDDCTWLLSRLIITTDHGLNQTKHGVFLPAFTAENRSSTTSDPVILNSPMIPTAAAYASAGSESGSAEVHGCPIIADKSLPHNPKSGLLQFKMYKAILHITKGQKIMGDWGFYHCTWDK